MDLTAYIDYYNKEYFMEKDLLCKDTGIELSNIFSDLSDDDLWMLILSKNYKKYPNIKKRLPNFPTKELQVSISGTSGDIALRAATASYKKIKQLYTKYSDKDLQHSNILDFGVGWGRILRFFLKDLSTSNLHGCDVSDYMLNQCNVLNVPGYIKKSDPIPTKLPFNKKFDLIYCNSVFSHLSEKAHISCLNAVYDSLPKGGMFITTLWTPFYAVTNEKLSKYNFKNNNFNDKLGYYFTPSKTNKDFGATFISLEYLKSNWGELFEICEVAHQSWAYKQVLVVLKKK